MTAVPATRLSRLRRRGRSSGGVGSLGLGIAMLWLSLIVLIPLAAVVDRSLQDGIGQFWESATSRQAISALKFTLWISLLVTAINAVMGTLIAWVLVRDKFPGKRLVNALIDLPFALPTIVAGIVLLALYGDAVSFSKWAVLLALLFVTLPFVIRAVQPVLIELDTEMEEAAHSLGASHLTTFRRVILPNLLPAIVSGGALAFARAVGEFGSIVLISGNKPFDTQVSAVYAYKQLESDNVTGAAAVSVVLLSVSLIVLIGLRFVESWGSRHDA
ncbi:MAG TPA: sulfate ABC transporter permease subunit CysT [Baekduia sp.]|nr:sulfate ABC transporter permease subunit CysT [Baekduia sp.]